MSQAKYLAASRGLRDSTLLLATTVATVLQSLPQALGIDQYRNLRKVVDGLLEAGAEMTELENELAVQMVEVKQGLAENESDGDGLSVQQVDLVNNDTGAESQSGGDAPGKKPTGRVSPKPAADAGKPTEGAGDPPPNDNAGDGAEQASLNV